MNEPNWKNRTIWTGDNLEIMRGMNSACIDLIYLDPPFNKNQMFSAPIGSEAAGASFRDAWTLDDVDVAWLGLIADEYPGLYHFIESAALVHGKSMQAYLGYMAVRLIEMHRILKESGSIFLHCDPTASHYLKVLMDEIFDSRQFRNEIVWCYTGPGSPGMRQFNRKHDIVLWYAQGSSWTFNGDEVRIPHKDGGPHAGGFKGTDIRPDDPSYGAKGKIPETWWSDIAIAPRSRTEYTGYPTQKPRKLLERIIRAGSNRDDMVLDPFCGCATTCIAAEMTDRKWVGIDLSEKATSLVRMRLERELGMFNNVNSRSDIPKRTDLGVLPNYRTHKHTLFGQQEGICAGCRLSFPFRNLTIDHIVPVSRGGTDHSENLQLLCGACNSMKGAGAQEELLVKLRDSGIIQ